MHKYIIKIIVFLLIITIVFIIICFLIGNRLVSPAHKKIGPPPIGLKAHNITIKFSDKRIKGWFLRSEEKNGIIILMHGVRGNRTAMTERAKFLYKNGYSVLLFDFQAHGESSGEYITFGYLESEDARAVVSFIKKQYPSQPVAVIGQSLGGASCLIGDHPIEVDALILESVYPTIEEAVANRLEIYTSKISRFLAPIFTIQLRLRFGINPDKLRPINGIKRVNCPVLIIGGSADRRTTLLETKRLYYAASKPKELWIIQNAQHEDLYQFAKNRYEKRISDFLKKNLNTDINKDVNGRL